MLSKIKRVPDGLFLKILDLDKQSSDEHVKYIGPIPVGGCDTERVLLDIL